MANGRAEIGTGVRDDGMIVLGIDGIAVVVIDRESARGLASDLLFACEIAETPGLSPNLSVMPAGRKPGKAETRCHGKAESHKPGKPASRKPGKP